MAGTAASTFYDNQGGYVITVFRDSVSLKDEIVSSTLQSSIWFIKMS